MPMLINSAGKLYMSRLEILGYYTKRENIHFAFVNRAQTTSKTPAKLFVIYFCCKHITQTCPDMSCHVLSGFFT